MAKGNQYILYVCDANNDRIVGFNARALSAEPLISFGSKGALIGELDRPRGLSIAGNEIVVAELGNNRCSVWTHGGDCTRTIGDVASANGALPLRQPFGVLHAHGLLLVTESTTFGRLVVFTPEGIPLQVLSPRGCAALGGMVADANWIYVLVCFAPAHGWHSRCLAKFLCQLPTHTVAKRLAVHAHVRTPKKAMCSPSRPIRPQNSERRAQNVSNQRLVRRRQRRRGAPVEAAAWLPLWRRPPRRQRPRRRHHRRRLCMLPNVVVNPTVVWLPPASTPRPATVPVVMWKEVRRLRAAAVAVLLPRSQFLRNGWRIMLTIRCRRSLRSVTLPPRLD